MKKILITLLTILFSIGVYSQDITKTRRHGGHRDHTVKTEEKYIPSGFGVFGILFGGIGTAILRKKKIVITKEGVTLED